jgi:hypothetical protein
MLDLEESLVAELWDFTREVRDRLFPLGGRAVVAEHGRVSACTARAVARHEPHCLHAHRLVFPGIERIDLVAAAPNLPVVNFSDARTLPSTVRWPGHYLYVEEPDGSGQLGLVEGPLPRQFLRFLAARELGVPELADWRSSPRVDDVERTRILLDRATVSYEAVFA